MANTGNTQQQIDYGAAVNDGTGDPLRTAFIKTDDNFDNVWLAGPVGSNITIVNNTVQVNNTNGNLVLSPNGVGVVQTNSRVVPRLNNTYDLGSATLKYRAGYFGAGGLVVDGNVTITGNLSAGNISYTGNVFVGDLQGSVYADDSTVMVDAVDNELFAARATISGNVSADYFIGNGSQLTGLPDSYGNANVVTLLAGFGSNTISTTGNITADYFIGNGSLLTGISSTGDITFDGANISAPDDTVIRIQAKDDDSVVRSLFRLDPDNGYAEMRALSNQRNTEFTTGDWATGVWTGTENNAQLAFTGATDIVNFLNNEFSGTTNQTISVNGGEPMVYNGWSGGGSDVTFFVDVAPPVDPTTITSIEFGYYYQSRIEIDNDDDEINIRGQGLNININSDESVDIGAANSVEIVSDTIVSLLNNSATNPIIIRTNNGNTNQTWEFGANGDLTVPGDIQASVDNGLIIETSTTAGGNTFLELATDYLDLYVSNPAGAQNSIVEIYLNNTDELTPSATIAVRGGDGSDVNQTWEFDQTGNLTLPAGGVVYETNIPGGLSGKTIALTPYGGTDADQQLLIYPTVGADANHLHLTSGNLYNTELFLGNDNLYVKLANTGSIVINTNDNAGNTAQWTFGANGGLTAPGNVTTTGNVSGNFFIGDGSQLTGITANTANITSNVITFNTAAGVNVAAGQMAWNSSDGTLNIGLSYADVVLQVGQETHYVVRNDTGNIIQNGTAVYCSGVAGGSGRIEASPMMGNIDPVQFLGLATQDINNGVNGVVTYFGYVRGLDTRGTANTAISVGDETWAVGDKLYVHPTAPGKLTNVEPAAPNVKICVASIMIRNQTAGVMFVRPTSNLDMTDLSDVQITSPASDQILLYDNNRWENVNFGIDIDTTPTLGGNLAGAGFNVSNVSTISATGNITGANLISSATIFGNVDVVLGNIANAAGTKTRMVTDTTFSYIQTGNGTIGSTGNIVFSPYSATTQQVVIDTANGNLTAAGNVTAQNFIGNISITGNVQGTSANVTLAAGAYDWTFDNTGNLTLPGNTFAVNYADNTPVDIITRFEGSWNVATGNTTQSFTVDGNNTYQMWVEGNIPNGIIVWNATVTVTNTNVPVIGQQFAWNYEGGGNILMFNSIPAQIIGTAGAISNAEPAVGNTTNVFSFGINNASGNVANVRYGWIKIS